MRMLVLALLVPSFAVAAPATLTSQGRLIDAAGAPINGDHTLIFSMYTDEAASTAALWSESFEVSANDGYYSAVLGSTVPIPSTVLDADSVYLGISVDNAPELRPRESLSAGLFALRADTAVNVSGGTVAASEVTVGDLVLAADGLRADGDLVIDANGLVTSDDWDQTVAMVAEHYYSRPNLVATDLPGSQSPGTPLSGYAHRSISNGSRACYGWARTTPETIDPSQNYELSIWIRSDSTDMNNYFGFHVYDADMNRIDTNGMNNPYFKSSDGDSDWTRWAGRLLHHGTPDSGNNGTPDSPPSTTNGTDWVMPPNAAYVSMRYGACFSETDGAMSDFALANLLPLQTEPVVDVQVDTTTRNHSTSWGAGPTFSTVTGFRAGSRVRLTYHVPMRNNSNSWGGGYIEPQIRFNGGGWQSLGSSGYDGGVMHLGGDSIGSYSNTLLIDPGQSSDFTVQTRFYFRSYDGTVVVNGSHNINTVSGTASVMSGVNGGQHYMNVQLEEVR